MNENCSRRIYLYAILISLIVSTISTVMVHVLIITSVISIQYGSPSFRVSKVWYHRILKTVEFYVENNGTADAHDVEVNVNGYIQRVGLIQKGDAKFVWISLVMVNMDWDSPKFTIIVTCREGVSKRFTFG